jgi:hypothetical protein
MVRPRWVSFSTAVYLASLRLCRSRWAASTLMRVSTSATLPATATSPRRHGRCAPWQGSRTRDRVQTHGDCHQHAQDRPEPPGMRRYGGRAMRPPRACRSHAHGDHGPVGADEDAGQAGDEEEGRHGGKPSAARVGDDDAALIGAQACAPRRRDSRYSGVVFARLFSGCASTRLPPRDQRWHACASHGCVAAVTPPYCPRASLLRAGA